MNESKRLALFNELASSPTSLAPSRGDKNVRDLVAALQATGWDRKRAMNVIRLCFYEGKKLTDAAKEMRVQPPRASRLRKQALQRLRRAIDKARKRLPEAAGRKGLAR